MLLLTKSMFQNTHEKHETTKTPIKKYPFPFHLFNESKISSNVYTAIPRKRKPCESFEEIESSGSISKKGMYDKMSVLYYSVFLLYDTHAHEKLWNFVSTLKAKLCNEFLSKPMSNGLNISSKFYYAAEISDNFVFFC